MRQWELSGFTDTSGKLQGNVGAVSEIWTPPEVTVGRSRYFPKHLCILYRCPDDWQSPALTENINKLKTVGWKKREHRPGLLQDLTDIPDGTPELISRFVLNWGPLWACNTHPDCTWSHTSLLPEGIPEQNRCFWVPAEPLFLFQMRARHVLSVFNIATELL